LIFKKYFALAIQDLFSFLQKRLLKLPGLGLKKLFDSVISESATLTVEQAGRER
jgi:hypothetical protein